MSDRKALGQLDKEHLDSLNEFFTVVLRSRYLLKNAYRTTDFFRSNLSLHFYNSILIFLVIKGEPSSL